MKLIVVPFLQLTLHLRVAEMIAWLPHQLTLLLRVADTIVWLPLCHHHQYQLQSHAVAQQACLHHQRSEKLKDHVVAQQMQLHYHRAQILVLIQVA